MAEEANINTVASQTLARVSNCFKQLDIFHTNTSVDEKWFSDALRSLFSELIMNYMLAVKAFGEAGPYPIAKPSELAWRTRNLLEICTWIDYFLRNRVLARSLYEDKTRDCLDWVRTAEKMGELFKDHLVPTTFKSCMQELAGVKRRTLEHAVKHGIVDPLDPFTRISDAAELMGYREVFSSFNKFLSKLAHPTAFTIFTCPDEAYINVMSDLFLTLSSACFVGTFIQIDKYLSEST